MIRILKYGEVANEDIFARVTPTVNVEQIVTDIIQNVRTQGDAALFAYTKKFDKAELTSLLVTEEEIKEALACVEERFINILKKGIATELTDADLVTISIGANNIMGVSVEKLGEYYLYSMIRDEALKKAKLKQIYQELKDVTEAGTKRFIEDIPTIIRLIKKVAPDARIIFQTVYNPFKNMELILEDFGDEPFSIAEETDKLVKALNDAIYAAADENGYEVCDVYTAFEAENEVVNCELYDIDLEDIMSSMMAIDPHPTEKGHILIADTIFAHLALK